LTVFLLSLLTPGIPELVKLLQSQSKDVFLVSGGFRQVIHPIAESLNIPVDHVFANQLLFKVRRGFAGPQ
jgi:phosphoserine phosphatase